MYYHSRECFYIEVWKKDDVGTKVNSIHSKLAKIYSYFLRNRSMKIKFTLKSNIIINIGFTPVQKAGATLKLTYFFAGSYVKKCCRIRIWTSISQENSSFWVCIFDYYVSWT